MITLRPYQEEFIENVRGAFRENPRVLCVLPTGSGKRVIACWMAERIGGNDKRVAVATDRRTLVNQMAEECREHDIPYGIIMGDSPRRSAPLQICSIQTLQSRKWKDLPSADIWIIDEAHKTTAAYEKLLSCYPKAKVLSFTATPVGRSGRSLVGVLGPIVEPYRNTELIRQGWLLETKLFAPSEPDLQGVSINSYTEEQLAERVEECTVFADVFRWWSPYREHQTIAFVPRVKWANWLAEEFTRRGHVAEVVVGGTEARERKDIFERFANRDVRVLVNVGVLVEGYDCPIADVGIDLTPNKQFRSFWQKVGRVRRPHEDQKQAIWFDFSGNIWRFTHPDDDPVWPTDEKTTVEEVIRKKKEKEEKEPWACPECGYVLASWERLRNGICPQCGRISGRPVRRIRMGNGQMKEVSLKKQRKYQKSWKQKQWDAALYKAHYSGNSIGSAAHIFKSVVGDWPDNSLSQKPPGRGSPDWKRKPAEVYPWMKK